VEAAVLRPDQVIGRHPAALENQFCGVRREPALLGQRAADAQAGRVALDREDRQAARALGRGIGARSDKHQVGQHAVGDEHLRAVEHPVVTVSQRTRADRRDIRAGVGLGDGHRRDALAGDDARQPAGLLGR
jgi:hypothetical protein